MGTGKNFEINVMMFGGRRSGKTSIIAAMQDCVENVFRDEELGLSISTPDDDTQKVLEDKAFELKQYYDSVNKGKPFTPDDNPTMSEQVYQFNIQLISKPGTKLQINFTDYPGEWLDNSSKFDQLKEIMKKSDIIMIAIDTPYLLEEAPTSESVGMYNEPKNFSSRIANMVKEYFVVEEDSDRKKMILFVPLKCEYKYNLREITKDEMEHLNIKVKKAYDNLLNFITTGANKDKYECAITPIFTLGNVKFARFDSDDNGYIMGSNKYPSTPLYRFDEEAVEPQPEYCEQPLLYSLVFLLKWAEQSKSRKTGLFHRIFDTLASRFLKFPEAKDFAARSEFLRNKLKKENNGYEIINDPLKFK